MFVVTRVLIKQMVASFTGELAGIQRKWTVIAFFKKMLLSSAWVFVSVLFH
jgi:hypothetical protein